LVRGDTLRRGTHRAYDERSEGIARPDRSEHEIPEPLNPVVGGTIILLISLALWWGLWLAISSL
jgi:hypothetical protein